MNDKKRVLLIILDGWGHREEKENNAIATANTPYFDYLWANFPHSLLEASGVHAGLPEWQMGNSEIGHSIIGAGKIINTELVKINKAILQNKFDTNPAFLELFKYVEKYNSTLHINGLIGPGGIHSHSDHLFAFLKAAKRAGLTKIAIHAFLDGRDTPPQSAYLYLKELENVIEELNLGHIATASGRYYAMDRDNHWDRIAKAEKAIFEGAGATHQTRKPSEIIKQLYEQGITDEYVEPMVFLDDQGNRFNIQKNDGVLFFNFRADRVKQLSEKITEKTEKLNLCFVTMTEYDPGLDALVAFKQDNIETTLAKEISLAGLNQVHIAETEKFAHVTYFLNGNKHKPHENEKHILIESRIDVPTHDLAPEMKAEEITDETIDYIYDGTDFILINFANPDMVGHTAKVPAIISAIETIDKELKRIVEAAINNDYIVLITADHGNAETNVDEFGNPHTAHTTNKVPAILIGKEGKLKNGSLQDVAPTILHLIGLNKPNFMTGQNLLE